MRKLETHLSVLRQQGLLALWHDRLITAGTDWAHAIDQYLETASVILLLVSADFFASDYCVGIEMKRALERQEVGEARIVPILVRPVDWNGAPFAHLYALPTDAKPLTSWQDEDTALADVAAGIRRVIVEELSLLAVNAPHSALPAIWNIPYPRNPFFIGRENLLSHLHAQLQRGQPMAVSQHPQAISGLGGIGKTQIAVEYAYRFHQEYWVVLWAQAESREALVSSYVAIAVCSVYVLVVFRLAPGGREPLTEGGMDGERCVWHWMECACLRFLHLARKTTVPFWIPCTTKQVLPANSTAHSLVRWISGKHNLWN